MLTATEPAGATDFRALFLAAPNPYLLLAPDAPRFTIIDVNEAYLRATMHRREALQGRGVFEAFPANPEDPHADGVTRLRASLERVLATKAPDAMAVQQYDLPLAGGGFELRHWSPVNTPVLDAAGQVSAILHHVEDVTDYARAAEHGLMSEPLGAEVLAAAARLRRADQARRESEARFRNMADNAPVMIWITDPTGYCSYLNKRWYEYTGQTPAEAQGYGWLDATHPDDKAAADEAFRMSNANRAPFRVEYRLRRKDGTYRWAIDAASPRFGEQGEYLGYVGSVIDIDERREMEDRLRENEERLRLATDYAEVGFWDVDAAHNTLFWPPRVKAMFGISPNVPVTMADFYSGLHSEDRAATTEAFEAAIDPSTRSLYDVEYRTIGREDGVIRWVAAKGRGIFDGRGRCVRVVGTAIDVTQRKLAEQHLRLMVNELNHRVKNTLATVQAIVTQTMRGVDVPGQVRDALIYRLLALSRAHDVLTEERWTGADLREIATGAAQPYIGEERSPFVIEGPAVTIPPRMAIALALAFHELATNAAKYGALSSDAGRVRIGWTVSSTPAGERLELEWRETGGPSVARPQSYGFGTRLIQRSLAADLGGRAELDFHRDGLVCRLSAVIQDEVSDPASRGLSAAMGHGGEP